MAGYLSTLGNALLGRTPRVTPMQEQGVSGTPIFGGYVENIERDRKLASGPERYRTVADILANVSIVAAGLRYFLNLAAAPSWSIEPAKDMNGGEDSSDPAKEAAEYLEAVLDDMATPWSRIVRRSGMYRFHGFGVQEWTAKRRPDGLIGLDDIESRPQHTIELWERDKHGAIVGLGQRDPQTGETLWLPRAKLLYLVDDSLTDSPEGMGWSRHLVEPAERLKKYLKLEGQGFERDMRGIPVGRAPLAELNDALKNGKIDQATHTRMLRGIRNFLKAQSKAEDTGLLLDSTTYKSTTADGETVSAVDKWKIDLLTGGASGFEDLGKSIERSVHHMALILGAEGLLLGSGGASGNRSLGEDKSRNLYINVNGALKDIKQGVERDVVERVWALNGFPDELKPKCKVEDASFKDAAAIAAGLRDMAAAGATLAPDDPAINDLRDLWGVSRAPEMTPEMIGMLTAKPTAPPAGKEPELPDDEGED